MKLKNIHNKLMKEKKNDVLELFLELLISEKIDYLDINEVYFMYLSLINKKQQMIIHGLATPLIHYWENPDIKLGKQKIFIKCKAAYYLLKSRVFNTALVEKDLQKFIKDNKYSEDENGFYNGLKKR